MNSTAPKSIGIIMDGNRRWAKERNLPTLEGHRQGLEKIKELMRWAKDARVEEVTLYAFSTENWNRSPEEVEYLMKLFEYAFTEGLAEIVDAGVRIRFIGERERFPAKLRERMSEIEAKTVQGRAGTLTIALSYGGRAEIVNAVNRILSEGKEKVTEEEFACSLWSAGVSDPDIIIRTGGDKRLSNFLTWKSVYSELFFTSTKWPDFSQEEFNAIIAEFASRERRLGK